METARSLWQWYALMQRYRAMRHRIRDDPQNRLYMDEALRPAPREEADATELMRTYAVKIPHTHGAPQPQRATAG
jgi:hypothetical protein